MIEDVLCVSFLLTNIHEAFQAATSELSKLKTIWEFLKGREEKVVSDSFSSIWQCSVLDF